MRVQRRHRAHEQQRAECQRHADDVATKETGGPVADRVRARADRFVSQVPAHVIGQCGDRGVTFGHVLLEGLGYDRVEVATQLATQPCRIRGATRRMCMRELLVTRGIRDHL